MGVTHFPNGISVGSEAGATALFELGGTAVNVTADQLNALAADSLSATELAYLDTVVAGTATASKAIVVGANKDIDVLDFSWKGGTAFRVGGTAVLSTATQLNYANVTAAGTAVASKAVVLGALKDIDTIDFASFGGVKIAGVALAGVPLAYTSASARSAAGTVVVPGGAAGTSFASGLTTVAFVVAGLYGDAGAGTASMGMAAKGAAGGTVTIVGTTNGGTAWGSGTATWIAIGT